MYKLNNKDYSTELLQEAAFHYNMDFNEYLQKMKAKGLVKINEAEQTTDDNDQNFQQDGVAGAGAPSINVAPENTDSSSENISLDLQDQQIDPVVKPRKGVRKNDDGSESTHLMAAEQLEDGSWVGFPTLFQDDDGTWIDKSKGNWKDAYNEALKRGEVTNFGEDKDTAIAFGEGSWKPKNEKSDRYIVINNEVIYESDYLKNRAGKETKLLGQTDFYKDFEIIQKPATDKNGNFVPGSAQEFVKFPNTFDEYAFNLNKDIQTAGQELFETVDLPEVKVFYNKKLDDYVSKEELNKIKDEEEFVEKTKAYLSKNGFSVRSANIMQDDVVIVKSPQNKEFTLNLEDGFIGKLNTPTRFDGTYDVFSQLQNIVNDNFDETGNLSFISSRHDITYDEIPILNQEYTPLNVRNMSAASTNIIEHLFKKNDLTKYGIDFKSDTSSNYSLAEYYNDLAERGDYDKINEIQTNLIDATKQYIENSENKEAFGLKEGSDVRFILEKLLNQNFISNTVNSIELKNKREQQAKINSGISTVTDEDRDNKIKDLLSTNNQKDKDISKLSIERDNILQEINSIQAFIDNNDLDAEQYSNQNNLLNDKKQQFNNLTERIQDLRVTVESTGGKVVRTKVTEQKAYTDEFGNVLFTEDEVEGVQDKILSSVSQEIKTNGLTLREGLKNYFDGLIKEEQQLISEAAGYVIPEEQFKGSSFRLFATAKERTSDQVDYLKKGLDDPAFVKERTLLDLDNIISTDAYGIDAINKFIQSFNLSDEAIETLKNYRAAKLDLKLRFEAVKNLYLLNKSPENFNKNLVKDFIFEAASATGLLGTRKQAQLTVGTSRNSKDIIKDFQIEYNSVNSEEIENKEVAPIIFNKKSEEALKRTITDEVVEGTGAFIPLAFEFTGLTYATGGTMTLLGMGNWMRRISQSKRFYDKAKYLALMSSIEELKTQAIGFKTGSGFTFGAVGGLTPSFKIKGKYSFFNGMLNKVLKGSAVGVGAGEAAQITEAYIQDITTDSDFNIFINNTYTNSNDQEIGRRLLTSAGTFGLLGFTHLRGKDISFKKYQAETRNMIDFYRFNQLKIDTFKKQIDGKSLPEVPEALKFPKNLNKEQQKQTLESLESAQKDLGNMIDARSHELKLDSSNPNFEANATNYVNKTFAGLNIKNKPSVKFVDSWEQLPEGNSGDRAKFNRDTNTLTFVKNAFNGGRFAHELTHFGLAAYFHKNPNELRRFNDKLLETLENSFKEEMADGKTLSQAIKQTYGFDLRKNLDRNLQSEEMLSFVTEILTNSSIGKNKDISLMQSIKQDIINFAERNNIVTPKINTGQQLINFLGKFGDNINQLKDVSKQIKRFGEIDLLAGDGKNIKIRQDLVVSSKDLLASINNLVPSSVKTKADFENFIRNERSALAVANALAPNGAIHNYVRSKQTSKIEGDKMLDEISLRVFNFDPSAKRADGTTVGSSGFGEFIFANTNFAKLEAKKDLAIEVEKLKQETSLDSEQAKDVAVAESLGAPVEQVKQTVLIDPTKFTGVPKDISIKSDIPSDLTMKKVSAQYAGEVGEQIFGIPANKIVKGGDNLAATTEATAIQQFYVKGNNLIKFVKILPEFNFAPTQVEVVGKILDVSETVQGTSISPRTSPVVLDYFYEPFVNAQGTQGFNSNLPLTSPKGRTRGKTSQTLAYRLKPQFRGPSSSEAFQNAIRKLKTDLGITPAGIPRVLPLGELRSPVGQLLKNVAKIQSQLTANKLVRNQIELRDKPSDQLIADIAAGKAVNMASNENVINAVNKLNSVEIKRIKATIGGKNVEKDFNNVLNGYINGNKEEALNNIKDKNVRDALENYFEADLWKVGIFQDVQAKNRGLQYEAFVKNVAKTANVEGIEVEMRGGFNNQGAGDLTIKSGNVEMNIELKLNDKAQMSSFSIKNVEGKIQFTTDVLTPELSKEISDLVKSKEHIESIADLNNEGMRFAKQNGYKATIQDGVLYAQREVFEHLKVEGFQNKTSLTVQTDASIISALYNKKGVNYIDLNQKGVFWMGENKFNINNVPELQGNTSINIRMVRNQIGKTGIYKLNQRAFPKLESSSIESGFNLSNPKTIKTALENIKASGKPKGVIVSSKSLNAEFNRIIERSTGIGARQKISSARAAVQGARKGKFDVFISPSAEDFVGLLYKTLGKGEQGNADLAFYDKHLLKPFAKANNLITSERLSLMRDYNNIKKQIGVVPKDLRKTDPNSGFTKEQAVRAYIWNKQGMQVPGINKGDLNNLLRLVNKNPELKQFGDQLISINRGDGYAKPSNSWLTGSITTDLLEGINTTKRAKHLEQWQKNVDIIFSKENLNKLEAAYGVQYRKAMENILLRMKTGRNRTYGMDSLTGRFTDWINGSVGAIMFFNTRSAVLQTISSFNFINFKDNNIFAAAKAFANQKQYWSDFNKLFNSDFLVARRDGLKLNVNEADIAEMAKKGGVRGVINELLRFGFTPTQLADSFAIASGGSTFYRNRIKTYEKQGLSKIEAEKRAFEDFRENAEESQQSSRPDKISQEQAGSLGRLVLAFANTPSQYARIIKKSVLDLKNGRGDAKTNISKIVYYTFAQNLLFNALQQGLFALAFGDDESDEKKKQKNIDVANGMANSLLRGMGFYGAAVAAIKDSGLRIYKESEKNQPKYEKAAIDFLSISPPISSKYRKIASAGRTIQFAKKGEFEDFSIDNPALESGSKIISATTNIPLDRLLIKTQNINDALNQDLEYWQQTALLLGWSDWQLGIEEEKDVKPKRKTYNKSRNYNKRKIYK